MKKSIYIETYGGLGDIALLTPVFKALRDQVPGKRIVVLCRTRQHREVLLHHPCIDSLRLLKPLHKIGYRLLEAAKLIRIHGTKYARLRPSFTYTKRVSQIIAEMIGVKLENADVSIFLSEQEQAYAKQLLVRYKNPVIIQVTSVASANQMWPMENWHALVKRMTDYTFIQLGLPHEKKVEGAIDMRGKTGIRESMALVKNARGFVGVVSFLSHVTNAFNTPGVVFFGPSSVPVWGHPNNINLTKGLPCSGCIDWLKWVPCPYNKPCMRLITVDEVEEAIKKQIPVHEKQVSAY